MLSMLSLFTPVGLTVCGGIHHTQRIYLMWVTVLLRRGCFPLACSPLSASAPWPVQGKRNNSPDMREEVREFCSVSDFVSELVLSVFPVFQVLDLKVWSHPHNLRNVGWKNHWEVIWVQPAAHGRIINSRQGQWFCWRALKSSKDGHSTTSLSQCCTAYLIKCNVQFELPKLKLVASSLHPLQVLRILEWSGPKAGNSIAQVSVAVLRQGWQSSMHLLVTDVCQSAIYTMRTHCWLIFGLVSSTEPSSFSKACCLVRIFSLYQ